MLCRLLNEQGLSGSSMPMKAMAREPAEEADQVPHLRMEHDSSLVLPHNPQSKPPSAMWTLQRMRAAGLLHADDPNGGDGGSGGGTGGGGSDPPPNGG